MFARAMSTKRATYTGTNPGWPKGAYQGITNVHQRDRRWRTAQHRRSAGGWSAAADLADSVDRVPGVRLRTDPRLASEGDLREKTHAVRGHKIGVDTVGGVAERLVERDEGDVSHAKVFQRRVERERLESPEMQQQDLRNVPSEQVSSQRPRAVQLAVGALRDMLSKPLNRLGVVPGLAPVVGGVPGPVEIVYCDFGDPVPVLGQKATDFIALGESVGLIQIRIPANAPLLDR